MSKRMKYYKLKMILSGGDLENITDITPKTTIIDEPMIEQTAIDIVEPSTKEDDKKCDEKILYSEPSKLNLYTIKKGTFLYHGTNKTETFDPYNVKLNDDTMVAFFSPDKELAASYISNCNNHPEQTGFIHLFCAKKDIDKIKIISAYEIKDKNRMKIDDLYCRLSPNREQLNGIGYFYKNGSNNSEFALCNPNEYLEYISTQRCISNMKLGNPYNFTQ